MVFEPISSVKAATEYLLITDKHCYEEVGFMTVYGIKAIFKNKEKSILHISSHKSTVINLISALKENNVEYYHFEAVVEDMIFAENFE